jgi:hypothetical protein
MAATTTTLWEIPISKSEPMSSIKDLATCGLDLPSRRVAPGDGVMRRAFLDSLGRH